MDSDEKIVKKLAHLKPYDTWDDASEAMKEHDVLYRIERKKNPYLCRNTPRMDEIWDRVALTGAVLRLKEDCVIMRKDG